MTASEWLGVMQKAQDFPKGMEKLIIKYGQMLIAESENKHTDSDMQEFAEWTSETGYKYISIIRFWERFDLRNERWDEILTTTQLLDEYKIGKEGKNG